MNISDQIADIVATFTEGNTRIPLMKSQWLEDDVMSVYFRYGYLFDHIEKLYLKTATVANVIVDPEHRQKGHFKRLLSSLEELDIHQIVVENILEREYVSFYESSGYIQMKEKGLQSPWFKKVLKN